MNLICVDENSIVMKAKLAKGVQVISNKEANFINKIMKKFGLKNAGVSGNQKITIYNFTPEIDEDKAEEIQSYIRGKLK